MNADRWARVESIAVAALERDSENRSAFLDEACAGDEDLRNEVDSLLGYEGSAHEFLRESAMEHAARIEAEHGIADGHWTIDGYDVTELLGTGGMGDVYRARDRRLDRDVAVKVIRSFGGDSPATFENEARAASALNHPNIVTIYSVGSHDDVAYIAMELVQGRTLRQLLADGPLPLDTILDIAAQLADGLAAAHAIGVVHRDLKPENVMVTAAGLVKILDFGIAKRKSEFTDPDVASDRSDVASTMAGTAGYMSPEQAAHQTTDHRSDQFAFGAIVYELLVGRRFFDGGSTSASVDRGARAHDEPIQNVRPDVPSALATVVNRCLSDHPERRYAKTHDLAITVRQIRDDTVHGVRLRTVTRRRAIWLGGTALLATATGAAVWELRAGFTRARRLAVLPFTSDTSDEDTEILCDGITEVLIKQLAHMTPLTNLMVLGRSTVFNLKGRPNDPRTLGHQLDVDAVLNGSVKRRGGRAIVQVELVNARTGVRLWGDEFSPSESDVLAVQDDIAAAIITTGLGIKLSPEERRQLNRMLTSDPAAYRLFVQGVHHLRLGKEAEYRTARELLANAVALDGTFALAWVTLASTHSIMAIDGFEPPHVAWKQAHTYVTRALQEDKDLPDAHAERAIEAFSYRWDWTTARREWDIALKSPRGELQAELLGAYALQQWALGRNDDALRFSQAARAVDPLSSTLAVQEANYLAASARTAPAAELYERVIAKSPDQLAAYFGLADVRNTEGRFDDAIDEWRRAYAIAGNHSLDDVFSAAHGQQGYRDLEQRMAEQELDELRSVSQTRAYVSPLDFARVHARLGHTEQAFKDLGLAFEHQAAGLVFLNVDRAWDSVRDDPRFATALRHIGLA